MKRIEALRDFPYKIQFTLLAILSVADVTFAVYSEERIHPVNPVNLDPILTSVVSNPPIYFALFIICAVQLVLLLSIRNWLKTKNTLFKKKVWNIICAIYSLIVAWNASMVAATAYLEMR